MRRGNKKLLAVASAGGHWTQLLLLRKAFQHHDVRYITTNINHGVNDENLQLHRVLDADSSNKIKLLWLALQILCLVLWHRPHTVLSTGAAPGFFAILFGKMIGAKTVWVDSMANLQVMSLSGKLACRFCDLCLTQWPNVADDKQIHYSGSLL
jgi:UDP-N-acetylglucosamine:LPS N-acetylglucosamine transferase